MPSESEVDRTCYARQSSSSGVPLRLRLQEAWAWGRTSLRVLGSQVSSAPWVAAVPLLLLVVLVVAGELGVHYAAQAYTRQHHEWAAGVAKHSAEDVSTHVQSITGPNAAVGAAIKAQPHVPTFMQLYPIIAEDVLAELDVDGSVFSLTLAPYGVVQGVYPAYAARDLKSNMFQGLKRYSEAEPDSYVLGAVRPDNSVVWGPFYDPEAQSSGFLLIHFVWIAGATANATFGNEETFTLPYAPGFTFGNLTHPQLGLCGAACANVVRDGVLHRFWGASITYVAASELATDVAVVEKQGVSYKYVLYRRLDRDSDRAVATFAAPERDQVLFASVDSASAPITSSDNPECVDVSLVRLGIAWTLCIVPREGWDPVWLVPVQIAVPFVAVVIVGLLFGMLASQQRHSVLVRQMLPEKVINRLNRGHLYTERFEQATVLFCDIVGYTTLSSELNHHQLVELPNALYSHFDTLVDKHKLYKVGTVGDAFMCVGGAPDPCHPQDAAVRVTRMALDMVAFANQYVLQDGRNIQIRVGVFSGDITASVVGKKMPCWFLVGDTVNVASRMESHSLPMHVHVGHTTAKLLAAIPEFTLQPRGK